MDDEESELLFDYFWQGMYGQLASSDIAVNHVLIPKVSHEGFTMSGWTGVYGRRPVGSDENIAQLSMPTTVMFGDYSASARPWYGDWLYTPSAPEAIERMPAGEPIKMVREASHHVYMHQPDEFIKLIEAALKGE